MVLSIVENTVHIHINHCGQLEFFFFCMNFETRKKKEGGKEKVVGAMLGGQLEFFVFFVWILRQERKRREGKKRLLKPR